MRVVVRYLAQVQQAAGTASEELEAIPGCTGADLLRQLSARHGDDLRALILDAAGNVQPTVLLFLDDEHVRAEQTLPLKEGAVLTVLTPMAGG